MLDLVVRTVMAAAAGFAALASAFMFYVSLRKRTALVIVSEHGQWVARTTHPVLYWVTVAASAAGCVIFATVAALAEIGHGIVSFTVLLDASLWVLTAAALTYLVDGLASGVVLGSKGIVSRRSNPLKYCALVGIMFLVSVLGSALAVVLALSLVSSLRA